MKATKIITGLLALLGFSACVGNGKEMYGPGPVEYGQPHADFELKGKVTDEAGDPIEGIRVSTDWAQNGISEYSPNDLTDERGEYAIKDPFLFPHNGEMEIVAEDIDGDENGGEFSTASKTITIESSDYVGGSDWYEGELRKTVDLTLELKPQEDEQE